MGTWSDPFHDVATAGRLAAVLRSSDPVPVPGIDVFYHLVGDDDLHDLLVDAARFAPGSDARAHVVDKLHSWLASGEAGVRWFRPWDPEAAAVVEASVADWFERHPEQAALLSRAPGMGA